MLRGWYGKEQLVKDNRDRGRQKSEIWPERQKARETGKKILAVFVWQQQAEEPQGHANERERPFSGGGRALPEQRWSRVFSRIPDLRAEEGGGSAEEGSLRGQGSELSGDPTTTNAALIFKLFHRQPCKTPGEPTSKWSREGADRDSGTCVEEMVAGTL